MRIMYLKEKKYHDNAKENPYGWSSWELEYKVDFTKQIGKRKTKWDGVKKVNYVAYIQGEKDDWYDDFCSKLILTIYKTITNEPKKEKKQMIDRKIADLDGY